MWLDRPQQVLEEMVRVARPGARIVVFEPDHETFMVDMPDRTLTRKIINSANVRNPWIGRQLPAMFKRVGLIELSIEPITQVAADYTTGVQMGFVPVLQRNAESLAAQGLVPQAEIDTWLKLLEDKGRDDLFFSTRTFFLVSGRKP